MGSGSVSAAGDDLSGDGWAGDVKREMITTGDEVLGEFGDMEDSGDGGLGLVPVGNTPEPGGNFSAVAGDVAVAVAGGDL